MAVKKPKAPAEELEQTVQGDQPDDAKKTRAKSKAAPKNPSLARKLNRARAPLKRQVPWRRKLNC